MKNEAQLREIVELIRVPHLSVDQATELLNAKLAALAANSQPKVTELVKDHGPKIDTTSFPPIAANSAPMKPESPAQHEAPQLGTCDKSDIPHHKVVVPCRNWKPLSTSSQAHPNVNREPSYDQLKSALVQMQQAAMDLAQENKRLAAQTPPSETPQDWSHWDVFVRNNVAGKKLDVITSKLVELAALRSSGMGTPPYKREPICGHKSSDGFVCCRLLKHPDHHADNDGNHWLTSGMAEEPTNFNPCDDLPRKSAERVPATNTSCDAGGESTAGNQSNSRGPNTSEEPTKEKL